MAGATLSVEWDAEDLRRVEAVFDRILRETRNPTPLHRDIGEYLLPAHQDRIEAGISPDGTPFAPLSDDYRTSARKQRSRGADKILILDDFLHGDLAYFADIEGLELGTNTLYGASHQFGRDDIPARPFLGFSDDDIAEIEQIALDYLEDLLAA